MTDWTGHTIESLIDHLRGAGYDTPFDLAEEFVRRGPAVVEALCEVLRDPAAWEPRRPPENMFPVHAALLLGAIGDPRAVKPLLEVTRTQDLEEYSCENLPAVLVGYGPSMLPALVALANDPGALPIGRNAAMQTMYLLGCDHPELRSEVMALVIEALLSPESPAHDGLHLACILEEMAEPEAVEAIREANAKGLLYREFEEVPESIVVGEGWQWKTVERDPMHHFGPGGTLEYLREEARESAERKRRRREKALVTRPAFDNATPTAVGPVLRATPKVGRNDPCPCGSGKKYKKCCGT